MTLEQLQGVANTISVIVMFIIIVYSGTKGVWVFRREVLNAEQRETWWKDAFFRLADTARTQADVSNVLKDEVISRANRS